MDNDNILANQSSSTKGQSNFSHKLVTYRIILELDLHRKTSQLFLLIILFWWCDDFLNLNISIRAIKGSACCKIFQQ